MTARPTRTPQPTPKEPELSSVDGLAQLSFLIHGILERRAAEQQLSITQTRLLGILRDRNPSMHELAELLGLDKSSTSGLVDRAERRGLVVRVRSPTDRRAVLVSLTDGGRALVAHVAARFERDVSAILACLQAADRELLSKLIAQVLVARASEQGIDLFPAADPASSATR